jgi:cellobiose-specific phosphotransferase system component IIA
VKGTSALLIGGEGNHRVVHSLRLAELGEVFIYEPALARGTEDIREAHKMQTLPIMAVKK